MRETSTRYGRSDVLGNAAPVTSGRRGIVLGADAASGTTVFNAGPMGAPPSMGDPVASASGIGAGHQWPGTLAFVRSS